MAETPSSTHWAVTDGMRAPRKMIEDLTTGAAIRYGRDRSVSHTDTR
jgi:hypothetical protein